MIIKPNYPQEVLEGTYHEKEYHNKGNRIIIKIYVKNKEIYSQNIHKVFNGKFPINLVDKIHEFINTYQEKGLLQEGINTFELIEHGGWGNNEWVTWFRPIEDIDKRFLKGETK